MREMKSKSRTSRTGVTRRKTGKSAVAPGKRRNTAQSRVFGKRKTPPKGPVAARLYALAQGEVPMRPFTVGAAVLMAGVVLYGLFVGGHVAAAGRAVTAQADKLMTMAGFSIQEVTVTGRHHTKPDRLLAALGISRGDPILSFDTEEARERVERLDWVKTATVTRLLPDAIRLDIVERTPFAIWQRGGFLSVVDKDGTPITDENIKNYASLPFIVGFGAPRAAPELIAMMAEKYPTLLTRVRAFVRVSERRWNLRLENGVDVKLPEKDVDGALERLVTYDAEHKVLSRDIVAVDLRLKDRVAVELTKEAADALKDGSAVGVSLHDGDVRSDNTTRTGGRT